MNKNISVWRGEKTPPTKYHLWQKDDTIYVNIEDEWQPLASVGSIQQLEEVITNLNRIKNIELVEVNASSNNILKSYRLKSGDNYFGTTIDIPKDRAIKDIKLGYQNASVNSETGQITIGTGTNQQYMIYSIALEDGSYKMISIDLSQLITEKEYKDAVDNHLKDYTNPHKVTKEQVGLGNVDNTSDQDKPVSTLQKEAIDKVAKDVNDSITSHTTRTDNPHSVTKTQVGLSNVTNDSQVKRSEMGVANGVATLDSNGLIPSSQLPSYVDDVLEYDSQTSFPTIGETGKIYVDNGTNLTYRWSGTAYVEIGKSLALGETSSTAYAGNKGKETRDIVDRVNIVNQDLEIKISDDTSVTISNNGLNPKTNTQVENSIVLEGASVTKAGLLVAKDKEYLDSIPSLFEAKDNEIAEMYKVMYNQHASVTLSSNITIFEKGVSNQIILNWNYIFNGATSNPESLQLKSGSEVLVDSLTTKTFNELLLDSKTYQVIAVNKGITKFASVTVNAYYPKYFGGSAKTTLIGEDILSMNKQAIKNNATGSYSFNVGDGEYIWLCIPENMTINKVTSSGFDVPMETPITVQVNGKGNYKCYRSSSTLKAGTFNCVIS